MTNSNLFHLLHFPHFINYARIFLSRVVVGCKPDICDHADVRTFSKSTHEFNLLEVIPPPPNYESLLKISRLHKKQPDADILNINGVDWSTYFNTPVRVYLFVLEKVPAYAMHHGDMRVFFKHRVLSLCLI